MGDNDRAVHSDEARRDFRALLNAVEHEGAHVTITRYNTPAAVLVPVGWHERARAVLAPAGSTKDRAVIHHPDGSPYGNDPAHLRIMDAGQNR